ncbi:MAG: hypothetical protein QE271_04230 [Bacteriovoracaceae bacterium]|nr:hypothetical protein [Bacteriovoracaceae bacterium]
MITVTCDLGTYSIKILESRQEAGRLVHIQAWEILINQNQFGQPPLQNAASKAKFDLGFWKLLETTRVQLSQLDDYLSQLPDTTRIIFQCPYELMSSRFKLIPAKNLKSAKLMLPFQIEEEIPYSLTETHLVSTLNKKNDAFWAFAVFCKNENFESFYKTLAEHHRIPNLLIHESNGYHLLGKSIRPIAGEGNYCILDMGHSTTKAYFFAGQLLVGTYVSYVSGSKIDDMLTGFYKIGLKEARDFKHETAFILPRAQFTQDLSQDQKVFAENLDDLMIPFVNEFKLWELSYRVSQNQNIDRVFLCGGTSRLKNMENYLSYHFNRPVEYLSDGESAFSKSKISPRDMPSFFTSHALSKASIYPSESGNLLIRQYTSPRQQPFPLHSVAFVAWRYVVVCLLVSLVLLGHIFFLQMKDKKLTTQLRPLINNPALNLPQDQKNLLAKKPIQLLKKIQDKKSILLNEIKHFQSITALNKLTGLSQIHQIMATKNSCVLTHFESSNQNAIATIAGCKSEDKENTKKMLTQSTLKGVKLEEKGNTFQIEYEF